MTQPSLFDLPPQVPSEPLRPLRDQLDPCAPLQDRLTPEAIVWPK
jgi:hypothetical protein